MTLPLYNRIISVKTGKQGTENVLNVSKLRVAFTIKKTHKKTENTAEINIYNLNETNRNKFSTLDNFIIIEAGYENYEGIKMIFFGNITDYQNVVDGANVMTKVIAQDGLSIQKKSIAKTYSQGVTANQVITDVIKSFGLPKKITNKVKDVISKKITGFSNGITLAGKGTNVLDQLSKLLGFEWSVQNNAIKITMINQSDDSQIIKLSKSSGLIGSPIRLNQIDKDKNKKGYELHSLLRADFEPARPVVVTSKELTNAPFRIEEVTHIGDNYSNDWTSKLIVSEV